MAKRGHRPSAGVGNRPRIWGRHPVTAALANPDRTVRKLWMTREAAADLSLSCSSMKKVATTWSFGWVTSP